MGIYSEALDLTLDWLGNKSQPTKKSIPQKLGIVDIYTVYIYIYILGDVLILELSCNILPLFRSQIVFDETPVRIN